MTTMFQQIAKMFSEGRYAEIYTEFYGQCNQLNPTGQYFLAVSALMESQYEAGLKVLNQLKKSADTLPGFLLILHFLHLKK